MVTEALDDEAQLILEAIWKAGSEADTSEIREYTGLSRGQIQYRVDDGILEEEGLAESRLVSASDEGSGSIRVTSLTERGDRIAGRVMDEDGSISLDKQVDNLSRDVQAVEMAVARVEGFLEDIERRMGDVETNAEVAIEEALEDLGEVEELDELVETAREIEEQYSAVIERNHELQQRLHDMREVEEAFRENGLLERSSTDSLVGTSDLHRFRALARNDVFARLVEAYTDSNYLGLDGEDVNFPDLSGVSGSTVEAQATPTASLSPEAAEQVKRLHQAGGLEALLDAVEGDDSALETAEAGDADMYDPTEEFDD